MGTSQLPLNVAAFNLNKRPQALTTAEMGDEGDVKLPKAYSYQTSRQRLFPPTSGNSLTELSEKLTDGRHKTCSSGHHDSRLVLCLESVGITHSLRNLLMTSTSGLLYSNSELLWMLK